MTPTRSGAHTTQTSAHHCGGNVGSNAMHGAASRAKSMGMRGSLCSPPSPWWITWTELSSPSTGTVRVFRRTGAQKGNGGGLHCCFTRVEVERANAVGGENCCAVQVGASGSHEQRTRHLLWLINCTETVTWRPPAKNFTCGNASDASSWLLQDSQTIILNAVKKWEEECQWPSSPLQLCPPRTPEWAEDGLLSSRMALLQPHASQNENSLRNHSTSSSRRDPGWNSSTSAGIGSRGSAPSRH